jgi:hypothetical protein
MTNFFNSSGQPKSRHVVVLYNKSTGEIRHIHEEIFLPGSKIWNKKQIEEAALNKIRTHEAPIKQKKSSKTSELAPLHVSHSDLKPHTIYRVDLKKKSLVELTEKEANRTKRKTRRKTK